MPSPVKAAKTVWFFGRLLVELVHELWTEDRKKRDARRVMSQRYSDASRTAGRESKDK